MNNLYSRFIPMKWIPILLGFISMYIPTYINLANNIWTNSDQAHGPLVLMIVLYLFWSHKQEIREYVNDQPQVAVGSTFLIVGLLFYILGRSQYIIVLDVGSQILVILGVLLITKGLGFVRMMWFPILFIAFLVPIPALLLAKITLPMKIAVSTVAENILYSAGYPIAREGVILQLGQYQLLVADACAGMHTLISLEALGLLYLNIVKHDSFARNTILALLIIPISFTANVIRVIIIALVTLYFGDEVGQGFIHGFAGMVLFIVALLIIFVVDTAIQALVVKLKK